MKWIETHLISFITKKCITLIILLKQLNNYDIIIKEDIKMNQVHVPVLTAFQLYFIIWIQIFNQYCFNYEQYLLLRKRNLH